MVKMRKHPFLLSRTDHGAFNVTIEIVFQEWTGLMPFKLLHHICTHSPAKYIMRAVETKNKSNENIAKLINENLQKIDVDLNDHMSPRKCQQCPSVLDQNSQSLNVIQILKRTLQTQKITEENG
jgi:transcription initiation factor IIF auxiliary subunit